MFFGGGTPTLLPPGDLARMLDGVRAAFGIAPDAEVTVEANPDTVTDAVAAELAASGVTRLSIGMQSAVPHVLAALDRTHEPANVAHRGRAPPAAPGSTSASTSSTARRGSRSRTGAPRSSRRSRSSPTTSRRTR